MDRPPFPASLHLLALHLARFESAGGSALSPHPFGFNTGGGKDKGLYFGPFCRSVGAHSTAQSWHTEPRIHRNALECLKASPYVHLMHYEKYI